MDITSWRYGLNRQLDRFAAVMGCTEDKDVLGTLRPVMQKYNAKLTKQDSLSASLLTFPVCLELTGASVCDLVARSLCAIPCSILDLCSGRFDEAGKILLQTPLMLVYDVVCAVLGLAGAALTPICFAIGLLVAIVCWLVVQCHSAPAEASPRAAS